MSNAGELKLEGIKEMIIALRELGPKVYKKGVRKALDKASLPIETEAKYHAKTIPFHAGWFHSGQLDESIGNKIKTYSKKSKMISVIGPRSGFEIMVTKPNTKTPIKYNPAMTGHLLEFGHIQSHGRIRPTKEERANNKAAPGKMIGYVPPYPFLRPAVDNQGQNAINIMGKQLWDTIEKELKK